jgi:hypothetical protein
VNSPDSLARGAAPARPGTLHARSVTGGIKVAPKAGATVCFGRGERPEVDLPVGEDDLRVSRRHGQLTYRKRQWWLRNTGQLLVRLPHGRLMHSSSPEIPLPTGYTPVFVKGSGYREHLVELYVTGHEEPAGPAARRRAATLPPKIWSLDEDERLLLVVMGQQYLLYEDGPRPLTYHQTAEQLSYLRPDATWSERRIEYKLSSVRRRLDGAGFPYPLMHEKDAGTPWDNNLLHNLLRGLVESTTLVPPDLDLIDTEPDD